MQNILHTTGKWLIRSVCRVKGLIWDSNFLVSLLAAILFGLVVVIVVVLSTPSPEWIYPTLGLSQKNDVLRFLGFGIGGTLLALSAVISYKRAKAFEDTAQNQEKGLRQERLKNAIKHLADRSASVRLGGAYELFHLAKDTRALDQTEDLSQTALDILCAHIRQTTREAEYIQKYRSEPSEEIQSLLNLLFVQKHEVFKDRNIDLRLAFLRGAKLADAKLQGADLFGVHLEGTDLFRAHLQSTNLVRAHLQSADLFGADLRDADLARTHLQGANLVETYLQGIIVLEAYFQGANLFGAHLEGADLLEAHLQGANLFGAHLQGADLLGAHLQGVVCEDDRGGLFKDKIKQRIGKESDLSSIIFSGWLDQEDVGYILGSIPNDVRFISNADRKKKLRERLIPHVGKPPSFELPEGSDVVIGSYTKEEAEKWIAEYNKAMSYKKTPIHNSRWFPVVHTVHHHSRESRR